MAQPKDLLPMGGKRRVMWTEINRENWRKHKISCRLPSKYKLVGKSQGKGGEIPNNPKKAAGLLVCPDPCAAATPMGKASQIIIKNLKTLFFFLDSICLNWLFCLNHHRQRWSNPSHRRARGWAKWETPQYAVPGLLLWTSLHPSGLVLEGFNWI